MTRWADATSGGDAADRYSARFDALAASGADVHGEAGFCAALVPPGSAVLDAGCGTGRVAIRLAELGYACVGVDVDAAMLAVARRRGPAGVTWVQADLAGLDLIGPEGGDGGPDARGFDLVVCAGNVIPLASPDTEARVVARMAEHLRPGGLLVTGFGLDRTHLPAAAGLIALTDYDAWCAAARLRLLDRRATWDGEPYTAGGGYAVSVHVSERSG